jgi:hypothetical protein
VIDQLLPTITNKRYVRITPIARNLAALINDKIV